VAHSLRTLIQVLEARLPLANRRRPTLGGTSLPLDLEGHAAKALSQRRRWTSGTIPPAPMLTDDRCQDAAGSVAPIASTRPVCASEVTSPTRPVEVRPRATRSRRRTGWR
jgi:hypothetical protein